MHDILRLAEKLAKIAQRTGIERRVTKLGHGCLRLIGWRPGPVGEIAVDVGSDHIEADGDRGDDRETHQLAQSSSQRAHASRLPAAGRRGKWRAPAAPALDCRNS